MSLSAVEQTGERKVLEWDDFLVEMRDRLDIEVSRLSPDTLLSEVAPSGIARVMLLRAISSLGGGLPDELTDTLVTMGEAFGAVQVARGHSERVREGISPVWLRGIRNSDLQLLYNAAISPRSMHSWRFRGPTPSPELFADLVYRGVLVQFIVEHKATRTPVGHVCSYDYQPENQLCSIAYQRIAAPREPGEMSIGIFHLVEFLFSRYPLRKIYVDVAEHNLHKVSLDMTSFREEGRLNDYTYFDNRWWDRIFFSTDRESWADFAQSRRPFVTEGLAPQEG